MYTCLKLNDQGLLSETEYSTKLAPLRRLLILYFLESALFCVCVCLQIDTSVLFWTERVLHMFKGKVQTHIKKTYIKVQTDRNKCAFQTTENWIWTFQGWIKKYFLSTSIQFRFINLPLPLNVLCVCTKVTAVIIYTICGENTHTSMISPGIQVKKEYSSQLDCSL